MDLLDPLHPVRDSAIHDDIDRSLLSLSNNLILIVVLRENEGFTLSGSEDELPEPLDFFSVYDTSNFA